MVLNCSKYEFSIRTGWRESDDPLDLVKLIGLSNVWSTGICCPPIGHNSLASSQNKGLHEFHSYGPTIVGFLNVRLFKLIEFPVEISVDLVWLAYAHRSFT